MEVAHQHVNIFMFRVPVVGDAPVHEFSEAPYKFWKVVGKRGDILVLRETVGKVSLQRRIDNFIRKEMGFMWARALLLPDHIEPAGDADIRLWASNHHKEMESLL